MSPITFKNRLLTTLCLLAATASLSNCSALAQGTASHAKVTNVDEARRLSDANPQNAALKFQYAEALKKAGKTTEAAREFLAVTEIDPSYYIAYHQLTLCTPDANTLSEAVKRLTYLMADKPKEMMLRVALSELFECQRDYFQASKVLVDLVYENGVPTKYISRVNNRIRLLQVKAREKYVKRKQEEVSEGTDTPPLPLPEENLARGLSASRLEKSSEIDGYGHSLLQH